MIQIDMQNFRFTVVEKANAKKPIVTTAPEGDTSSYYGRNVFNRAAMRKYLSEDTRRSIYETIEKGTTLDRDVANHVAKVHYTILTISTIINEHNALCHTWVDISCGHKCLIFSTNLTHTNTLKGNGVFLVFIDKINGIYS